MSDIFVSLSVRAICVQPDGTVTMTAAAPPFIAKLAIMTSPADTVGTESGNCV
jgi:hypothetical protein